MPEILLISGKGGTGKTSLTAAFAHLAANAVICDLDVDTPDLHLLLQPETQETSDFFAGHVASIQAGQCEGCGICQQMCRFDAIRSGPQAPVIDPLKCEGCKVCVEFCPAGAIAFTLKHCGEWYVSQTRFGPMVHARLTPGEENSGRLVALLRQKAKEMVKTAAQPLILSDGPPGIGCPVISSLSGVDLAVLITEPTPSGLHDLSRISDLCHHFRIPAAVILNKCDLNAPMTREIEDHCRRQGHSIVARLPHDPIFVEAMVSGAAVTESGDATLHRLLKQAWDDIQTLAMTHTDEAILLSRAASGAP